MIRRKGPAGTAVSFTVTASISGSVLRVTCVLFGSRPDADRSGPVDADGDHPVRRGRGGRGNLSRRYVSERDQRGDDRPAGGATLQYVYDQGQRMTQVTNVRGETRTYADDNKE